MNDMLQLLRSFFALVCYKNTIYFTEKQRRKIERHCLKKAELKKNNDRYANKIAKGHGRNTDTFLG